MAGQPEAAGGGVPGPPAWFAAALADSPQFRAVAVDGVTVRYRAWGPPGAPVVLLVHGGDAYSGWWDHIAPHLARGHRVVAPDLTGHGDSGRRPRYRLDLWAGELLAVAERESGPGQPATVIGHSLGGFVTLAAATLEPGLVSRVVLLDSAFRRRADEKPPWDATGGSPRPSRVYPSREAAESRFRPMPSDTVIWEPLRRHLARDSVIAVPGGWSWKFDPAVFCQPRPLQEDLLPVGCPALLVRGERGLAGPARTRSAARRLGALAAVSEIPDAGHHVLLDQPVAVISLLAGLLAPSAAGY
jgi:pimeloyl-ACP methyl ester carboxylesterase